jgi:hypothetical protein
MFNMLTQASGIDGGHQKENKGEKIKGSTA